MTKLFVLLWMIFFHIVDDYYLQGWLASAKQRSWWEKNAPEKMYENDYICALLMHGFSWAFMIMLPIAWYMKFAVDSTFFTALMVNMAVHAIVDDMKANKKMINLCQDQCVHLGQIFATALVLLVGM
jgi:hypothetical protein